MQKPNQKDRMREDVNITAKDLLQVPQGDITETGLRNNINVALQYMEAWLGGNGCVPIHNLMEDAATAEISRTQIWQWIHNPKGVLNDGRKVTVELFRHIMKEEMDKIHKEVGDAAYKAGHYPLAAELLEKIATDNELAEFLTSVAYEHLP
jgi:malate synthase